MCAKFLEKKAIERNINVVEGEYTHSSLDENGNIKKLHLSDSTFLETDFVFDCAGFSRFIVGKLYNQKWISYSNHLPMKKGIPFWLDSEEEIRPCTTATAMKYGWMWNIPLQHRIGSGYIFDSDYINEEQALLEAEKYLNRKLEIRKIIPFEAGRLEKFWVKNCISVGLSSSFIEPLESTSIFHTIEELRTIKYFLPNIIKQNEKDINKFNELISNNMDEILNFVYLHYITKRNDSDFWKNFKHRHPVPKKLIETLDAIKDGNLNYLYLQKEFKTAYFSLESHIQIGIGLELSEKFNLDGYRSLSPTVEEYHMLCDSMKTKTPIHHNVALEKIRSMYEKI